MTFESEYNIVPFFVEQLNAKIYISYIININALFSTKLYSYSVKQDKIPHLFINLWFIENLTVE